MYKNQTQNLENDMERNIDLEVKASHQPLSSSVNNIASKIGNIAQVGMVNAIEGISNKLNVDIYNKQEVAEKIRQLNELLKDPTIRQQAQETLQSLADDAVIFLKASEPAVMEFVDVASEATGRAASKIGENMASIALNTLEAIPGPGIVVGLARDIDKGTQAVTSAIAAAAEVSTAATDAIQKTSKRLKNLQQQNMMMEGGGASITRKMRKYIYNKERIMNKVGGSLKDFHDTTLNPHRILRSFSKTRKMKKINKK
jgi:hypothetical protein